jgi:hypothetical protein
MPGIALVSEIEQELGGIADLAARLGSGQWRAGELVTLTHILLQAAGNAADWLKLGDGMVAEGLALHAEAARAFLNKILDGETAS